MMDNYRTRVALSVFENAADLALAVSGLQAAGIAPENLIRIPPEAGKAVAIDPQAGAIAKFIDWAPPRMAADLTVALAAGSTILIVVINAPGTEQTVSRALLESSALGVQLHDLGS
jgi:hypothetical protein